MKVYVVTLSQGSYSDQTWELMPTAYLSKDAADLFVENMNALHKSRNEAWSAMDVETARASMKFDIDNAMPIHPASFKQQAPKKTDLVAREAYDRAKKKHDDAVTAYYMEIGARTTKLNPIKAEIQKRHTDAWIATLDPKLIAFANKYCPLMLTDTIRYSFQEDDYDVCEVEVEE